MSSASRDRQAAEPEVVAQQVVHHGPRQRRRQRRRRRSAPGSATCADITSRRRPSIAARNGTSSRARRGLARSCADHRQLVVACRGPTPPRPGKCLTAAATPGRPQPADHRRGEPRRRRPGRRRTSGCRCAGLAGFVGEVADRRVDDVHAHRQQLAADRRARPARPGPRRPTAPSAMLPGERRRAVAERVELAALLVGGDQERRRGRVERRRPRAGPTSVSSRTCAGRPRR